MDELAAKLASGPDERLRRDQGPAQRLAVRPDGRAARPRGVAPAAVRGVGRLPGGRPGVPREATPRLRGPVSGRFPGARPYTADAVAPVPTKTRRRLRTLATVLPAMVLGALVLAPGGVGRLVPAGVGRLAERRRDPDPLHPDRRHRPGDLHRRRGPADLLDVQVPRPQGPRRGADPRQHAARDRLDRRRGGDPDLPDRLHVPAARRRQEPGGVADRRRGQPGRRQQRLRRHRPARAARGQRVDEHPRRRRAVLVELLLSRGRGRGAGVRLQRHVRAGRHDRHARRPVQGRRPLVVDPRARRQDGRGPGPHEQDLVPDPARRDPRG